MCDIPPSPEPSLELLLRIEWRRSMPVLVICLPLHVEFDKVCNSQQRKTRTNEV